uniref:Uncharacterized protein n=1 Tax=Anguilla anguilla TaxID=7936 RepID=A0A0E9PYY1_ANGAN
MQPCLTRCSIPYYQVRFSHVLKLLWESPLPCPFLTS